MASKYRGRLNRRGGFGCGAGDGCCRLRPSPPNFVPAAAVAFLDRVSAGLEGREARRPREAQGFESRACPLFSTGVLRGVRQCL